MAKLDDVAKDLKVEINIKQQSSISNEKAIGHKRRSWLEHDDTITNSSTENRIYSDFEQLPIKNEPVANREQTDSKLIANNEQTGSNTVDISVANREQTDSATGSTIDSKAVANREQTDSKLIAKFTFSELVGLQREIIIFICHECKNSRSKITEALTLEYVTKSIKHSAGAVKNAIGRLEKKGCLIRIGFKNGRGGWSRYEIPDNIYHDALRAETDSKLIANSEQIGSKVIAQPVAQLIASVPSSSSLSIKETTTEVSDEWNFDITHYAQFGFTITQVKQLASLGVITANDVEQSLIEFSYDLNNNTLPSIKTTKINFLMGLLRSGHVYISEGFKNEQEAMILEMSSRREGKRKKLIEAKFGAWEETLRDEERNEIVSKLPPHLMSAYRAHGIGNQEIREWMFDYFTKNTKG